MTGALPIILPLRIQVAVQVLPLPAQAVYWQDWVSGVHSRVMQAGPFVRPPAISRSSTTSNARRVSRLSFRCLALRVSLFMRFLL